MILATTKIEDLEQFVKIYGTRGAEKRKLHGSKGSTVFRDPNEEDRVWAIFDWDLDGWGHFASDPEVPPIMRAQSATESVESWRSLPANSGSAACRMCWASCCIAKTLPWARNTTSLG